MSSSFGLSPKNLILLTVALSFFVVLLTSSSGGGFHSNGDGDSAIVRAPRGGVEDDPMRRDDTPAPGNDPETEATTAEPTSTTSKFQRSDQTLSGGETSSAAPLLPLRRGPCKEPLYSSVVCVDNGKETFYGSKADYWSPVVNRSCLYKNLVFDKSVKQGPGMGGWVFYKNPKAEEGSEESNDPKPVTLSSKGWDYMERKFKRDQQKKKIGWTFDWKPLVREGPIPCEDFPEDSRKIAFYSPVVPPFNWAHTLLCELFGLFWAMTEFNVVAPDWQVVAVGAHHQGSFKLNKKKAPGFQFFSRLDPIYDSQLMNSRFPSMICGTGTKTWSWVTTEYRASGTTSLWWDFRKFIIAVVGAKDRIPAEATYEDALKFKPRIASLKRGSSSRHEENDEAGGEGKVLSSSPTPTIKVSICNKKGDKRGIMNYEDLKEALEVEFQSDSSLSAHHPLLVEGKSNVKFNLETAVGKTAREQVQMMLDTDVFICNEGTLGATFFFMPPGSAFLSIPLVYHTPHLHQMHLGPSVNWWKKPDMLRPDPRKQTGGNIDWFHQAINWVHTEWYNYIPLNETKLHGLSGIRNHTPDNNIKMNIVRALELVKSLLAWVLKEEVEESENYSVTAGICREILHRHPEQVVAFNTPQCFFGMSWLCEFWANAHPSFRVLHPKWQNSHGRCGDLKKTDPVKMGIEDPRDQWPMEQFRYYTKEELIHSYTTTDVSKGWNLHIEEQDVERLFPSSSSAPREEGKE